MGLVVFAKGNRAMQHTVILDTNLIFEDPKLGSGPLNHLVRACRAVGVTVALPEIVVLELVAPYEPGMRKRLASASKAINDLDRYIYTKKLPAKKLPALSIDAHSLEAGYEKWLRNRLNGMGILILKLPEVPQQAIMERVLKKRRPFIRGKKGDSGYKDTLIGETILDYLDSSPRNVVLVTNDDGFSYSNGSQIHDDLEADLTGRGLSGRVTLKKDYDGATEFLNGIYDFQTALLKEEEWAKVSKEKLASEIPFADLLNQQKFAIQSELASEVNYLDDLQLHLDVEPDKVDFEPEYIGNGEWKVSGIAHWETEIEYYDFNEPQFLAEKSVWMELEIDFTIYYDYKDKDVDPETIINSVTQISDPVGSHRPEELTNF